MQSCLQNTIIAIKTIGFIKEWRVLPALAALFVSEILRLKWNAALVTTFIVDETIILKCI